MPNITTNHAITYTLYLLDDYFNNNNNKKKKKKIGKIFITKPQLKSYLQSTCCYKKSNQFIKSLSTIPSLENKNNPIYYKWRKRKLFIYKF